MTYTYKCWHCDKSALCMDGLLRFAWLADLSKRNVCEDHMGEYWPWQRFIRIVPMEAV